MRTGVRTLLRPAAYRERLFGNGGQPSVMISVLRAVAVATREYRSRSCTALVRERAGILAGRPTENRAEVPSHTSMLLVDPLDGHSFGCTTRALWGSCA